MTESSTPSDDGVLRGVPINDEFTIQEFLRREKHCEVYTVKDNKPGASSLGLEARVYVVGTEFTSGKERRLRLRHIKRQAAHLVVEVKVNEDIRVTVTRASKPAIVEGELSQPAVLLPAGSEGDESQTPMRGTEGSDRNEQQPATGRKCEIEGEAAKDESVTGHAQKPPKKTKRPKDEFQSEYNRISQRYRRQAKRNRKKGIDAGSAAADEKPTSPDGSGGIAEDEKFFAMLTMLYLTHEKDGRLRSQLPHDPRLKIEEGMKATAEQYMKQESLQFVNVEEMEEYTNLKLSEAVYLRYLEHSRRLKVRQHSPKSKVQNLNMQPGRGRGEETGIMARTEKHYNHKLLAVMRKQVAYEPGSEEWVNIANSEMYVAKHQHMIVTHAETALPAVAARAESVYRELKMKIKNALELNPSASESEGRVRRLNMWWSSFLPLSPAHTQLSDLVKAERNGKLSSEDVSLDRGRSEREQ